MRPPNHSKAHGFTLIELLATIAIMAVLVGTAVVYVPQYISWAKDTANKQTLAVLNDALTRYKTQGGTVSSLTLGAPIGNIIARLKTPVNWAGMTHQFLQSGMTVPARSLVAVGTGAQYRFYGYENYRSETPAAGTPNSVQPYGAGIGYFAKATPSEFLNVAISATSGWTCFQNQSGTKSYFAVSTNPISPTYLPPLAASTSYTFWACAGNGNPTASGSITHFAHSGQEGDEIINVSITGLTGLQVLSFFADPLSSLSLQGLSALTQLNIVRTGITSIDIANMPNLTSVACDLPVVSYLTGFSGDLSAYATDGQSGASLPVDRPVWVAGIFSGQPAVVAFFNSLPFTTHPSYIEMQGWYDYNDSIAASKGWAVGTP